MPPKHIVSFAKKVKNNNETLEVTNTGLLIPKCTGTSIIVKREQFLNILEVDIVTLTTYGTCHVTCI